MNAHIGRVIKAMAISVTAVSITIAAQADKAGDLKRGAAIAERGTPAGAVACVRCHGFDGNADGSGAFPVIAGQSEFYLSKQLRNYGSGARRNPIMTSIAAKLSQDDITAVSAYYASLSPRVVDGSQQDPALIQRGTDIVTVGDLKERVEACQSCHGPHGLGEAPDVPRLAGQYGHYLATQLQMWRRGYRKNDPGSQMKGPAHNLGERDIAAVAAYFAQQAPVAATNIGGRNGRE